LSITTYSELQTAVSNWLKRSDLTSYIPDFVTLGEARIFRELRSVDMETSFSTAITTGVISLPTSYLALKFSYINSSPVQWLGRKTARWIYENYPTRSSDSTPKFIAREGQSFIFGPYPDSGYTVKGVYYKNIGPLSSSAHAVFTNNPDLYLFAALVAATPFIKDDKRVVLWEAQYQGILKSEQGRSDKEEYSGSPPQMTPG